MSRSNRKIPVTTAKMYRHFAVLTLAITAAIAMFAQGEKDEAAAAPATQGYDEVDLAARDPQTNRIAVSPVVARRGQFGDDAHAGFDSSAVLEASNDDSLGSGSEGGMGAGAAADIRGMAESALAQSLPANSSNAGGSGLPQVRPPEMSKEEWEALLARKRRDAALQKPDAGQVADMLSASRERAGASDGQPD
jgi:hypothetical protein